MFVMPNREQEEYRGLTIEVDTDGISVRLSGIYENMEDLQNHFRITNGWFEHSDSYVWFDTTKREIVKEYLDQILKSFEIPSFDGYDHNS